MASGVNHEDERKKKGVMYVYKLDTGRAILPISKPNNKQPQPKKAILRGSNWALGMIMRRSKTTTTSPSTSCEIEDHVDREHRRGSTSVSSSPAVIISSNYVEGRKSSSSRPSEPRKSVSQLELVNVASVAAFLQVKILVTDMPGFMQVHAFRCARKTYDCLHHNFSSKHMAYNIKKEFDKVYGPAWHCIVGSSFGSFVTHSTGGFLYFSMEKLYILLFKTKVQRAQP